MLSITLVVGALTSPISPVRVLTCLEAEAQHLKLEHRHPKLQLGLLTQPLRLHRAMRAQPHDPSRH